MTSAKSRGSHDLTRGSKGLFKRPRCNGIRMGSHTQVQSIIPNNMHSNGCHLKYLLIWNTTGHLITVKKGQCCTPIWINSKTALIQHKKSVYFFEQESAFNPSGHAVQGIGLQLLACWDCGFESCQGHECLSLLNVVCRQVEASATGRSLVQRSPTKCVCGSLRVINCDNNLYTYNE